jgi:hypothetical protein
MVSGGLAVVLLYFEIEAGQVGIAARGKFLPQL